ncbi:MAG: EscN/YscN/HrcN family type III secretion system ATPase, partial [Planctomycetales bacterium]
YPAIDILQSISRLAPQLMTSAQQAAADKFRSWMAAYRDHADLISIGAYRHGTNPHVDQAIELLDTFNRYLQQSRDTRCSLDTARAELISLALQEHST